MIEYQRVEAAVVYPQSCVLCTATKGPFVDTFADRWGERLYVCRMCTQRLGRALGIVKGDKHEELLRSAELLAEKDREIAMRQQQQDELRQVNGQLRAQEKELRAELQAARGRIEQVSHLAAIVERNTAELMAAAAAPVAPEVAAVA